MRERWAIDETYMRMVGRWVYAYRAVFLVLSGRRAPERGGRDAPMIACYGHMFELVLLGTAGVMPRLASLVAQGVSQINVGPPLGPEPRRTFELVGEPLGRRL